MGPTYRNWDVRGERRPVMEADATGTLWPVAGEFEVYVVVTDPDGRAFELTAEDGRLTSLKIIGGSISSRSLAHIPLVHLQDVATTYLANVQQAFDSGLRVEDALREADRDRGEVRTSTDRDPTLADFAAEWRATPAARMEANGTKRVPRRELLAKRYGVSVYTIDSLVRRARANNLIPPATTGRGNKTTDAK